MAEEWVKGKTCDNCGNPVGDRNKTGLCRECASPKAENHYNWQGKTTAEARRKRSGRNRAEILHPIRGKLCIDCGVPAQHRDHMDGDPMNNDPSNIEFRCRACHCRRHAKDRWDNDKEYREKMLKIMKAGMGWPRKG